MSTIGIWIGGGWLICGFLAATLHQSTMDKKRTRGAPWTYFWMGYAGLVFTSAEAWQERSSYR